MALAASAAPAAPARDVSLFVTLAPWAPAIFALALMGLGAFAPQALNDGDTFWHIEAGRWTLAHGGPPHTDPFSYTYAGAPWVAHEWFAEVLMALAFGAAGLKGVTALTGLAIGLSFFALARAVREELRGPAILGVLGLAALIAAPSLLARPHILALAPMTFWIVALWRTRDGGGPPSWFVLPLMTVWANMHGGFVFGLALIGPFALDALIGAARERRMNLALRWAAFAALAVIASLLNPYGIEGLLFPFRLANNANMAIVNEWQPEKFTAFGPFEWALLALFGVGFIRGLHLGLVPAALVVLLVAMTAEHTRHALLFAYVAPLLVARAVGEAFGEAAPTPEPEAQKKTALAFAAGVAALIVARLIAPLPFHDTKPTPVSALAAVPAELRAKPVFNTLSDGGYLVLNGVKPFIDGRFDMYPKAHVDDYMKTSAGEPDAARRVLDDNRVAWVLLQPTQKLVGFLDAEPGWKRLYADAFAVVFVREDLGLRGEQ
jgi:hypothetical protein